MGAGGIIRAGAAFVEFFIKDGVSKSLDRIGKKIKGFGTSIMGMGAKVGGLGAMFAAPFAAAIKSASDMEEIMNKFNVVFGENAKEVKAWGDQFAASVGRSKKQVAEFMANSQDLFVPLGFASDAALDLSKQVTGLAVDLASFNNKADADVLRDLHAALTGSGEVMKKYGVVLSEAAVKQELLNQGLDPKIATNQQKAQARFNIILRGTTAAQGDAIRSSGSFANKMKALRARVDDASVSIGAALLPTIRDLVARVVTIVGKVAEWAAKNGHIIKTIALVAAGVTVLGIAIVGVGAAIAAVGAIVSGIATIVGILLSPIGLVVAAIAAITTAWLTMSAHGKATIGSLLKWFNELKAYAMETWKGIAAALKAGDMKLAAKIAWIELKLVWQHGVNAISRMWALLKEGMISTFDSIITWIRVNWAKMAGWLGAKIAKVIAFFTGKNTDEAARMVEQDTKARIAALERERKARDAARQKQTAAAYADADKELETLRKERDDALEAAKQLKTTAKETPPELEATDTAAAAAIDQVKTVVKQMSKAPEAFLRGSIGGAKAFLDNQANTDGKRAADASERTAAAVERLERGKVVLADAGTA